MATFMTFQHSLGETEENHEKLVNIVRILISNLQNESQELCLTNIRFVIKFEHRNYKEVHFCGPATLEINYARINYSSQALFKLHVALTE
jgi:hypothetical protein